MRGNLVSRVAILFYNVKFLTKSYKTCKETNKCIPDAGEKKQSTENIPQAQALDLLDKHYKPSLLNVENIKLKQNIFKGKKNLKSIIFLKYNN